MAVTLTENAAKQIRKQLAKRGKGLALMPRLQSVRIAGADAAPGIFVPVRVPWA